MTENTITVAAMIFIDQASKVLHVRKRDTKMFMLPGGKPEPGEQMRECIIREIAEELAVSISPAEIVEFGVYTTLAANEPNTKLVAHVFQYVGNLTHEFEPKSEIVELTWLSPHSKNSNIAPLNLEHIFPKLLQNEV